MSRSSPPSSTPAMTGSPRVEDSDHVTIIDPALHKRSVRAAALGNMMEWFDFGVYSYLAATIGKVFFSQASQSLQLVAAFGTFAAAFLIRPVGGMVLGPLGDLLGRQRVLSLTMIMMAIGTFSIGLIPSYDSIGVAAPLLLLLARLVQGFSTGGEYGGAATFIAEYSTDRRRGFAGSFLEIGTISGYLMGAILVTVMTWACSPSFMLEWGWRIPFFISAPLGLFGFYMRTRVDETPSFKRQQQQAQKAGEEGSAGGLVSLLKNNLRPLLQCVGLVLLFNVSNYMLTAYMPSYLGETLHMGNQSGLLLVVVLMFFMLPLTLMWGHLTDTLGRRPVLAFGAIGLIVLAIPAFWLITSAQPGKVFAGLLILGVLHSCFSGTTPSTLPALFTTRIRYSALAISFNLSVSVFGGTTPLINAWLVNKTGNVMVPAYYMLATGIVGLLTVWTISETSRKPLKGSPPAVASQKEARHLLARFKHRNQAGH